MRTSARGPAPSSLCSCRGPASPRKCHDGRALAPVTLVSSHSTASAPRSAARARGDRSPRLPIGVATRVRPGNATGRGAGVAGPRQEGKVAACQFRRAPSARLWAARRRASRPLLLAAWSPAPRQPARRSPGRGRATAHAEPNLPSAPARRRRRSAACARGAAAAADRRQRAARRGHAERGPARAVRPGRCGRGIPAARHAAARPGAAEAAARAALAEGAPRAGRAADAEGDPAAATAPAPPAWRCLPSPRMRPRPAPASGCWASRRRSRCGASWRRRRGARRAALRACSPPMTPSAGALAAALRARLSAAGLPEPAVLLHPARGDAASAAPRAGEPAGAQGSTPC